MDNGALLVIEEQELVKKTVKFIKTGENVCEKCYFHDHGHCPWDCDDGYYVEHNPSNWHTGTPIEEGRYLIENIDGHNEILEWYNGHWYEEDPNSVDCRCKVSDSWVVAWLRQKIESYKEKKDRQSDFIKKIFDAFPNAYINHNNEVIISEKGNVYFGLLNVNSNDDLMNKILSWCSRDACKSMPYNSEKLNEKHHAFIRHGCNKILGVELSEDDWWVIYERLGNNVNPQLAKRFIESDFDMSVLKED